ncbi:glycosyltransferase family 2 protein [Luteimonas sp. e5]
MNKPWLSILIPFHNVRDYLAACVDSVLAQWQPGVEVLLLDDGSSDDSAAIAAQLVADSGGRLRLLHHAHNRGMSAARNSLLHEARGEWVWFLDSDDLLFPGALQALHERLRRQPCDLVVCDFRRFRSAGRLKHRLKDRLAVAGMPGPSRACHADRTALMLGLLAGGQMYAWNKVARREVWLQAPFPEGRSFEDIAVMVPLAAATRDWVYVRQAWVGYRVRSGSITATPSPARMADLTLALCEMRRALIAWPGFEPGSASRRVLDRFCLHRLGAAARWQAAHAQVPANDCAAELAESFPEGLSQALDAAAGWSTRLRMRRARRRMQRAGWLP